MQRLEELRAVALRLADREGIFPVALSGVTIIRGDAVSAPTPLLYTPRLCVGIEGDKELGVGDRLVHYGAGEELVVSVAMPVTGRIVKAPYLAFVMDFDLLEIAEMVVELPQQDDGAAGLITGVPVHASLDVGPCPPGEIEVSG